MVKKFGSFTAVNSINLEVQEGQCFGLLGPNGAGKSTLITLLYGASYRSSGELKVLGLDPEKDGRKLRSQIGVVTQEDCLDEALSVEENMLVFADLIDYPKADRAKRVHELLEFMSLSHRKEAQIKSLSGGMKRRLVFVRALLGEPRLVILDEPTTGLDPAVRHLLWEKIKHLKAEGKSIILTTHYMDEAEKLCDRLVIMDQGQIVADGSPRKLIADNCPGFIANFSQKPEAISLDAFEHFEDAAGFNIRGKSMEELTALSHKLGLQPQMIRPSNLEDVFLYVTGKELSADA